MTPISIPVRRKTGTRGRMKTMVKEIERDTRMDIK